MKYLVCLFIVALWLSPNVARAEEISGGGIGGHSVDPTGSPPPSSLAPLAQILEVQVARRPPVEIYLMGRRMAQAAAPIL